MITELDQTTGNRPRGPLLIALGLFSAAVQFAALVAFTVAGTILSLRWVATSQHPTLISFLRPLTHCRVPAMAEFCSAYATPFTLLEHTPPTFNYAIKQCGAEIIPGLTGTTGSATDSLLVAGSGSAAGRSSARALSRSQGTEPDYAIDGDASNPPCWEFEGDSGQLGFALVSMLNITSASIGHYDESAIHSAPRSMVLWGLMALDGRGKGSEASYDQQDRLFRRLHYYFPEGLSGPFPTQNTYVPLAVLDYSPHLMTERQTFSVFKEAQALDFPIGVVVLQVISNWGSSYTRLCQVGIHGAPVDGI